MKNRDQSTPLRICAQCLEALRDSHVARVYCEHRDVQAVRTAYGWELGRRSEKHSRSVSA